MLKSNVRQKAQQGEETLPNDMNAETSAWGYFTFCTGQDDVKSQPPLKLTVTWTSIKTFFLSELY